MWAARQMIDMRSFADAHRLSDDVHTLAFNLGVMPRDVRNFVKTLTESERIFVQQLIEEDAA